MNYRIFRGLILAGLAITLFAFVGCKEDDEETPPAPPPIVAHWDAANPSVYGATELEYFINQDNTYRAFGVFPAPVGDLDERGTYTLINPDSCRFLIQTVNGQPPQGENLYSVTYTLSNSNNDLHLTYRDDQGDPFTVNFVKVP
jgi:hypothetical protein